MKAQLMTVIRTEHCRGLGTEQDVCRTVVSYHSKKGELLYEVDPCKGEADKSDESEELNSLRERVPELAEQIEKLQIELGKSNSKRGELMSVLAKVRAELRDSQGECLILEKRLKNANAATASVDARNVELEKQLADITAVKDSLVKDFNDIVELYNAVCMYVPSVPGKSRLQECIKWVKSGTQESKPSNTDIDNVLDKLGKIRMEMDDPAMTDYKRGDDVVLMRGSRGTTLTCGELRKAFGVEVAK